MPVSKKFKGEMAKLDIAVADHLSIGHCENEDCLCGMMSIQMFDDNDELFAVAYFKPASVESIIETLRSSAKTLMDRRVRHLLSENPEHTRH